MPAPKQPPRKALQPSPRFSPHLSPKLAELQQILNAAAESERMTRLVDYLDDLRKEFDWAAAELKTLGFCAPCYLSELDDGGTDGSGHDCPEDDW